MSGDANSLIVDLNDLLKRDPTLSSLSDDPVIGVSNNESNFDFMTGMQIPKANTLAMVVPNNSPATWTSTTIPPPNTVIKSDPTVGNQVTFPFQPTLAQLNTDGIKMETSDLDYDEIQPFFVKNNRYNI